MRLRNIVGALLTILISVQILSAQTVIILHAKDNDGSTLIPSGKINAGQSMWILRSSEGKDSWGIQGTKEVLEGDLWFNNFPGPSGEYQVELGAILEPDGHPAYGLKINDTFAPNASGNYPKAFDSTACTKGASEARYLNLGTQNINNGDKISVYGKTTYECYADAGAYTRWWELKFTLIENSSSSSEEPVSSSSSVDRTIPVNSFWVKSNNALLENDMKLSNAKSSISANVISGINGSLDNENLANVSMAEYNLDFPVSSEWFFAARYLYSYENFENDANSYWISVDDGTPILIGNGVSQVNQWHWDGVNDGSQGISLGSLSAGSHNIKIYAREASLNSFLDVMSFSPSVNYFPHDIDQSSISFKNSTLDPLTLLTPSGGEEYQVGDSLEISWKANSVFISDAKILLSPNSGKNWIVIVPASITTSSEDWGLWKWNIPESINDGSDDWQLSGNSNLKIKICDYDDCDPTAQSASFSVKSSSTTILNNLNIVSFRAENNYLESSLELKMIINLLGEKHSYRKGGQMIQRYYFREKLKSGVYWAIFENENQELVNFSFTID